MLCVEGGYLRNSNVIHRTFHSGYSECVCLSEMEHILTVLHFWNGPLQCLEDKTDAYNSYNVTAGRAGRDGVQSTAILYLYLGSLFGHVSKAM